MRQHNNKRYGRKASAKRQWLKFAVLAFGVVDAAGIYYAHQKLNKPVPDSLEGQMLALQQQTQAETPRVINPVSNEQLAANQPAITLNPELRFSPSPSVADPVAKAPAPQQLAKADIPAPAFGKAAIPAVAVAPAPKQAPVVVQTTLAKPVMAIRSNAVTNKAANGSLVQPMRAVPLFTAAPTPKVASIAKSIPAPAMAKASPMPAAKAQPKAVRQAGAGLHTILRQSAAHQASVQPIQHSSVRDQTAAFNTAFADLNNTPDDVLSVQDEQQHVASAPSVVDLPSSAPQSMSELPAVDLDGNSAG